MSVIIVAGSPYTNFDKYIYNKEDIFIGLEEGCMQIIERGYPLSYALGDFDHTDNLELIKSHAKSFTPHTPIKNEIDLELALMFIEEHFKNEKIYIYNATSGRLDHELITIKLLFKYSYLDINLINEDEIVKVIDSMTVLEKGNYRFSLIVFEDVTLDINNAAYPLDKIALSFEDNFTSSNEVKEDVDTIINIFKGRVLLVKEIKKA